MALALPTALPVRTTCTTPAFTRTTRGTPATPARPPAKPASLRVTRPPAPTHSASRPLASPVRGLLRARRPASADHPQARAAVTVPRQWGQRMCGPGRQRCRRVSRPGRCRWLLMSPGAYATGTMSGSPSRRPRGRLPSRSPSTGRPPRSRRATPGSPWSALTSTRVCRRGSGTAPAIIILQPRAEEPNFSLTCLPGCTAASPGSRSPPGHCPAGDSLPTHARVDRRPSASAGGRSGR